MQIASDVTENNITGCPYHASKQKTALHTESDNRPVEQDTDGAHRCPGAYIAIEETDIFLMRFLKLDDLRSGTYLSSE